MTTIAEDEPKRKSVSEVAREVTTLIGVMIKTGAAQPGKDAMRLLEPLVRGEYDGGPRAEKPKPKRKPKAKLARG